MKRIIKFIQNLKIKHKVLLCILSITTFALLLVSALSYQYFSQQYVAQANSNSSYTLKITAKYLNLQINSAFSAASRFLSNKKLIDTLHDINQNKSDSYISNYIALDSDFTSLIQSSDYISNAFLIDKQGKFYSSAEIGINYDTTDYFHWDLSEVKGITFLSARDNPVAGNSFVIPIIIPITYEENMNITLVSESVKDATAILIVLLNNSKINDYFHHVNNNKGSFVYLTDENGRSLSLRENTSSYKLAEKASHIDFTGDDSAFKTYNEIINNEKYLVSAQNVNIKGLKVMNVILKKDLLYGLNSIRVFILISWLLCSAISVLLSVFFSRIITNPINKLVQAVNDIQDGQYKERQLPYTNDEIGVLNSSIDDMYHTIQQQILVIKDDMEAKAAAEIRLLSNQINPHFLYNTLECIHFEILNSQNKEAASMVESLGQFLRIGLNYGNDVISIKSELTHGEQYINLMNHMSNHKITFHAYLSPEVEDFAVLKLILQPLLENCIKHGFKQKGSNPNIFAPTIDITVKQENSLVKITVTDNGLGIDCEKARTSLYQLPAETSSHIGLNNIYRRLRTYYGEEVSISFFSIPYFQNSVIIQLPKK
jgi:two-component system, sensor histidine kinase YesM